MRTLVAVRRDPAALLVVGSLGLLAAAVVIGQRRQARRPDRRLDRDHRDACTGRCSVGTASSGSSSRSSCSCRSGATSFPEALPFNLELYRVVVAFVVAIWIASLLVDDEGQVAFDAVRSPVAPASRLRPHVGGHESRSRQSVRLLRHQDDDVLSELRPRLLRRRHASAPTTSQSTSSCGS